MTDAGFENIYFEEIYQIPSKTTIIISNPWSEVKVEQRSLLFNILLAFKLSLDSVRIIHQSQFDLMSLKEKPSRMIAFVAPPKGLALYEVIHTGETSVVFSDPLENLNSDDVAKRKLWNSLKALFPA